MLKNISSRGAKEREQQRRSTAAPRRGFTGVRRRRAGSYQAMIKDEHLGTFATAREAAEVVEAAEVQHLPRKRDRAVS
jgi:hypothetical protein